LGNGKSRSLWGQEAVRNRQLTGRDVETRCFAYIKAHLCRRRLSII
jgi:hypothetical protein